ncbi:MAG: hypothetical protein ABEJ35_02845 [Halobacteriaceae archaeon]
MAETPTTTITIEADDGSTDTVTLPEDLIGFFNEGGEPSATVVGDVLQIAFTQRAHSLVHHAEGDVDERVAAAETAALEAFEERFGQTFAEMTGHDH